MCPSERPEDGRPAGHSVEHCPWLLATCPVQQRGTISSEPRDSGGTPWMSLARQVFGYEQTYKCNGKERAAMTLK